MQVSYETQSPDGLRQEEFTFELQGGTHPAFLFRSYRELTRPSRRHRKWELSRYYGLHSHDVSRSSAAEKLNLADVPLTEGILQAAAKQLAAGLSFRIWRDGRETDLPLRFLLAEDLERSDRKVIPVSWWAKP